MKAILLAGVTSMQSFPVRTTGPKMRKHALTRRYMIFCTLVDISARVLAGEKGGYTFGLHLSALTIAILHQGQSIHRREYLVFLSDIAAKNWSEQFELDDNNLFPANESQLVQ